VGKCFTRINKLFLVEYNIIALFFGGAEHIIVGVNEVDYPLAKELVLKYDNLEIKVCHTKGTAGCLKDLLLTDKHDTGVVLYGDTVYFSRISGFLNRVKGASIGQAVIGVKNSDDLANYMAVVPCADSHYLPILKPHGLRTGLAYIGLFGFHDDFILDKLNQLSPSLRGELEMTDLIKLYAHSDNLNLSSYRGQLIDCNTIDKLLELKRKSKSTLYNPFL